MCHFNIEEISKSKFEVLSKIINKERVDVIALQETHTVDDEDIGKRGFIQGYLLSERYTTNNTVWPHTLKK